MLLSDHNALVSPLEVLVCVGVGEGGAGHPLYTTTRTTIKRGATDGILRRFVSAKIDVSTDYEQYVYFVQKRYFDPSCTAGQRTPVAAKNILLASGLRSGCLLCVFSKQCNRGRNSRALDNPYTTLSAYVH